MAFTDQEKELIEAWVYGWSISRETPMPQQREQALYIDVNSEGHRGRHILLEDGVDAITEYSKNIYQPDIYIKGFASTKSIKSAIDSKWTIDPPIYMMDHHIHNFSHYINNQHIQIKDDIIKSAIHDDTGAVISSGQAAIFNDHIIFDQIVTDPEHRRKGLGKTIMNGIATVASEMGKKKAVLVATEEGKLLYQYLGWHLFHEMTSIVIKKTPSK